MSIEEATVLFVHDDEDFRKFIQGDLADRGMVSLETSDGDDCISVLDEEPVDVVVLDTRISGTDWVELLGKIKKKDQDTEVILLTDHGSGREAAEGIRAGAFGCLARPLDPELLMCKIEQAHESLRCERERRRESETKYQALLDSVTDYVIGINSNYQIIMANNLFRNEFGMQQDAFCYEVWKKRDRKCRDCLLEKTFRDGQPHTSEETVVMKDGRIAQMLTKATPVMNEGGRIAYVLETATDITVKERLKEELKRMSGNLEGILNERLRELEKSEERYRTIFERSLDAIIHTDPRGRILEINQAGLHILGYRSKNELLSQGTAMDLFENRKDLHLFQRTLFREGFVTEFETRLMGKRDRPFDAVITSSVIFDVIGQVIGYVMIIRDVTERKSAQEQVKRQNIRLAALNAISVTVSSSLDLNEVLDRTIDKMLEVLGPDCVRIYLLDEDGEILHLAAHRGFSPEFIEKEHMKSRQVGDGLLGKTVLTCEARIVDNTLRSTAPYVDSFVKEGIQSTVYIPLVLKGDPVGVMCVCTRSRFKFSEDYVDFLTAIGNQIGMAVRNAILYQGANRAYQELKEAQEQVIRSEKLASLGKLSATIAHEINNPIAAVLTYVKLMMKLVKKGRFSGDRVGDISRYLDTMASEMSRCGEIVKNLLAFSRQTRKAIKPQKIDEIVHRTLVLTSHDLELKGIVWRSEIAPNLPMVRCDFRQIQQVLLNLISNASEAMEGGGVLSIRVGLSEKKGFLEIAISDTGYGILEEDQKSIFEPFFTTKEEGKGVGLGLSVVYGIITNHNGTIQVESEPGKGSTFRVFLPVEKRPNDQRGVGTPQAKVQA
ncbi:MAG TPA: PAS domain S-box protein [Deltaproteobacteria bacterium]|nr:PAS domain S-box protein [Deltaproteobacteria bacterium]